jgi:hypothetical protein
MHSVENGFYWLAGAAGLPMAYGPEQDKETCFSYLCNHLRIDKNTAQYIVADCKHPFRDEVG